MKIAVFYPDAPRTAWSATHGIESTLRRMGHQVVPGRVPVDVANPAPHVFEAIKATFPSLETLRGTDAVILSGPEHIVPWLDPIYGLYEWKTIAAPKLAWYHESFFREDYTIDFDTLQAWSDEHFFPAIQDAEFHDQESFAKDRSHWLPLGVDTKIFRAIPWFEGDLVITKYGTVRKTWDIGFIGWMYEKRARFLKALSQHNHPRVRIGGCSVTDLGGFQAEDTARRLADNYRRVGVFFNLPALSQLLVSKVYEVMSCGTFLLTPMLSADRGISKNMDPFESGRHLVYYRSSNVPFVAQLLREWSSEEKAEEREKIAATGSAEVHKNHSLEKRLEVLLAKCGVKELVQ
jgi:glycosyltransferase involved in cell wall biosynthesis